MCDFLGWSLWIIGLLSEAGWCKVLDSRETPDKRSARQNGGLQRKKAKVAVVWVFQGRSVVLHRKEEILSTRDLEDVGDFEKPKMLSAGTRHTGSAACSLISFGSGCLRSLCLSWDSCICDMYLNCSLLEETV